jgi:hypothetical protein
LRLNYLLHCNINCGTLSAETQPGG